MLKVAAVKELACWTHNVGGKCIGWVGAKTTCMRVLAPRVLPPASSLMYMRDLAARVRLLTPPSRGRTDACTPRYGLEREAGATRPSPPPAPCPKPVPNQLFAIRNAHFQSDTARLL